MIFSPKYIESYDGLDERTFMYGEENILHIQLLRDEQVSVYMPEICIRHIGDGASKALLKKNNKRRAFGFRHALTGWRVCLDLLLKYKEENGHELYEEVLKRAGQ